MRNVPYPHPGEILLAEFLKPMGIAQYRLAKEIGVAQRRIGEIVAGKRAITADAGLLRSSDRADARKHFRAVVRSGNRPCGLS